MNDVDFRELQLRLAPYVPLTTDVLSQVIGPFMVGWSDGICRVATQNGRISAYRTTLEEAIAALALEVMRDDNPLTRWNR